MSEIDWSDDRLIGCECWFWNYIEPLNDGDSIPCLSTLTKVELGGKDLFRTANSKYLHCRLAQGNERDHDDKGQPVPDGVMVKLWFRGGPTDIGLAENYNWEEVFNYDAIIKYQIQEQLEPLDSPDFTPSQFIPSGEVDDAYDKLYRENEQLKRRLGEQS